MDPQIVNIRRSGNLLEIEPGRVDILGLQLTYTHRDVGRAFDFTSSDKSMKCTERELYRVQGNKLYTLQGAKDRVINALTAAGCNCQYTDLRIKKDIEPDYEWFAKCMPDLDFRFKQDDILAMLIGRENGQIVAPTAYGKTFIMLALAALYPKAWIIIASPSTALLRGTYRRMLKITPDVGRVGAGQNDPQRITLCTFNSIIGAPVDKCDILLIDESHRASAPQISANIARIRNVVKTFGMTATPKGRSDNAHLPIEVMLGPKIISIEYDEAVNEDIISPLKVGLIEMPEGSCRANSYDYATKPAKKRHCYWRNNARNIAFAEAIRTYPVILGMRENPQTLVLVETSEHAFRMAKLLPDFEVVYANMSADRLRKLKDLKLVSEDYKALTGSQRNNMLQDFEVGKLRKVIATGCWGEGVDFINLDVVANLSGSPSPIATVQWAGRNSRMYEGKSFGLVIDSIDKWDRWTYGRAQHRLTEYRKKKWELLKGLEMPKQPELQLTTEGTV